MRSLEEVNHAAKYLKRKVGLKGALKPGELTAKANAIKAKAVKQKLASKLQKGDAVSSLPTKKRVSVAGLV